MSEIVKMAVDSRGNFRRDLGWEAKDGGYVQHRFYVGKDRAQAAIRVSRLERLWDAVERVWNEDRQQGRTAEPRPVWDVFTLSVGMAIAKGDETVEVDPSADSDRASVATSPLGLAAWFGKLSANYGTCGVRLILPHEAQQVREQGEQFERQSAQRKLEDAQQRVERLKTGETLHQALDAFGDYLGKKYTTAEGIITPTGKRYQRQAKQIRDNADDMPLSRFNLDAIDALLYSWQRRPVSKRTGRIMAVETVRDCVKRIREFLRWLHRSSFNWRLPEDYVTSRIRIQYTPAEMSARAQPHGRRTYTVDELCTLWEYASPWERLLIVLALNCGFGGAEIATLQLDEITLDSPHGHYPVSGSFIKRIRFKTGVYGEWLLLPETVKAIEWMKKRRGETSETVLVLSAKGRPLSTTTKGGSRNMRIANTWKTLLQRVRKDFPQFRELSFNKLRKTAASFVHGSTGERLPGCFCLMAGL